MDHYTILGVSCESTDNEVKAAYKKMALKWHPDRHLDDKEHANTKFVEISNAYTTVLRERRRSRRNRKTTLSSPETSETSSRVSSPSSSAVPEASPKPAATSSFSNPHPTANKCQSSASSKRSCASSHTPTDSNDSSYSRFMGSATASETSSAHSFHPSGSVHEPDDTQNNTDAQGKIPRSKLRKQSKPMDHRPDPYTSDFTPKASPRRRKSENTSSNLDSHDKASTTLLPEYDHAPSRGACPSEWVYVLRLSLEELFHGKKCCFRLVRCKLSGKKKDVILDVHVPSGCQDGTKIIYRGAGHERKDGTRQDIVFLIKEIKHNRFQRVHDDLILDVRLPWVDSLNEESGKVFFTGVDGKELRFDIDFPRYQTFTGVTSISSAGMSSKDGSERGRMIIRWEIYTPQSTSTWETIKQVLKF